MAVPVDTLARYSCRFSDIFFSQFPFLCRTVAGGSQFPLVFICRASHRYVANFVL